jgi:hypothetical protein
MTQRSCLRRLARSKICDNNILCKLWVSCLHIIQIKFAFSINQPKIRLTLCTLQQIRTSFTVQRALLTHFRLIVVKFSILTNRTRSTHSVCSLNTVTLSIYDRLVHWTVRWFTYFCCGVDIMCDYAPVASCSIGTTQAVEYA